MVCIFHNHGLFTETFSCNQKRCAGVNLRASTEWPREPNRNFPAPAPHALGPGTRGPDRSREDGLRTSVSLVLETHDEAPQRVNTGRRPADGRRDRALS